MSFAERAAALSKSTTQAINDRATELKRQGRDLIRFRGRRAPI